METKIDYPYFITSLIGIAFSIFMAFRANRTLSSTFVYILCGIMFILCVILFFGSLNKEDEDIRETDYWKSLSKEEQERIENGNK